MITVIIWAMSTWINALNVSHQILVDNCFSMIVCLLRNQLKKNLIRCLERKNRLASFKPAINGLPQNKNLLMRHGKLTENTTATLKELLIKKVEKLFTNAMNH